MSENKEIGGRKILVYYILAIVLPCIALGILAFRGIRNDRALVEKENRRSLLEIGGRVSTGIQNRFDTIGISFIEVVSECTEPGSLFFSDSLLAQFVEEQPLLSGLYYLRSREKLCAMEDPFLYLPDAAIRDRYKSLPARLSAEIDKGWEYEFRRRDYARAITYYRGMLKDASDKEGQAVLLSILARLYRKAGDLPSAIETYQQIMAEYADVYLPGAIHGGLSASRELIKLRLARGDTAQAGRDQCSLIDRLINLEWKVSKSQLMNTLLEISGRDGEMPGLPACNESKTTLDSLSERTAYFLDFMDLGDELGMVRKSGSGFHLQHKGKDYVIADIPASSGEWILMFDPGNILDLSIKPELAEGATELGFHWAVLDRTEKPLANSGNIDDPESEVRYALGKGLPQWTIVFFPGRSGLLDSFLDTGKGIYFYIFLLIIIILAFGLFFTLNTVNQEIRLSKMKSYFISTVSHEFKSPLTSIRQMAEMLDTGRVKSDQRRKAYYASMLHQSERLSHLIENILDFARMEDGRKQYQFEPGNLLHLVEEVFSTFDVQLRDQGYELRLQAGDDVPDTHFDREAIEQVMHNLLDNAVKYGGDQKRIEVKVYRKRNDVVISIRDDGIGIHKADQEKIFTRFYRAGDALTSKIKGSGIGLTIVRQIIEAHGGTVSVTSKPGRGSTFLLHLPIQKEP